jgi:hypothetical protein
MERSIGLSLFGLPRRILDLARDRKNTAMRDSAEIQDLIARGDLERYPSGQDRGSGSFPCR